MRNPFLLRASEQNISDEEFARYFAPGVLDLLPGSAEHETSHCSLKLARRWKNIAISPPDSRCLRHIIGMNRGREMELYSRLRELKVVGDDRALLLGASLACRASYGLIAYRHRQRSGNARSLRCSIAGWFLRRFVLRLAMQLRFPAGLSALKFKSAERLAPERHEELTGAELFEWASNIEGQLFRAFDSFSASEFPGQEEFSAFPWLAHREFKAGSVHFLNGDC